MLCRTAMWLLPLAALLSVPVVANAAPGSAGNAAVKKDAGPVFDAAYEKKAADFWAVTNSDEFRRAEKKYDVEKMKSLLGARGIDPSPRFPQVIDTHLCLPPNHWVNELAWIYGPHPLPNGPVLWYLGWMPVCEPGPIIV